MDCGNSSGIGAVSGLDGETALTGLRNDMQYLKSAVSRLELSMSRTEANMQTIMNILMDGHKNGIHMPNTDSAGSHAMSFVSLEKRSLLSVSGNSLHDSREMSMGEQSLQDDMQDKAVNSMTSVKSQSPLTVSAGTERERGYESMSSTADSDDSEHFISGEKPVPSTDICKDKKSFMEETVLAPKEKTESDADISLKRQTNDLMSIQWDATTKCVPYYMLRRAKTEPLADNRVVVLEQEGLEVKFGEIDLETNLNSMSSSLEVTNGSTLPTQNAGSVKQLKQKTNKTKTEDVLSKNGVDSQSESSLESLNREEVMGDQSLDIEANREEEESEQFSQKVHKQPPQTIPEHISGLRMSPTPEQTLRNPEQISAQPQQIIPDQASPSVPEQTSQNGHEPMLQSHNKGMAQIGSQQIPQAVPEMTPFTSIREHVGESNSMREKNTTVELSSQEDIQKLILNEAENASKCTDPKSDGMDTVLCLDISASMDGEPLQFMKNAVANFLDGVETAAVDQGLEENVAIVSFGKENKVLQHLTNDYGCVRDVIDVLEAGGPSPLMTGLMLCLSALNGRGGEVYLGKHVVPPRIILFTDAKATQERRLHGPEVMTGEKDSEMRRRFLEFGERLSEESKYITCIPVGECDQDVLELLSQMNGGKIVSPDRVCNLSRHFYLNTIVGKVMGDSKKQKLKKDLIIDKVRQTYPDLDQYDVDFISEQLTLNFCHENGEMPNLPVFGSRVRRGKDWKWNDQDSDGVGTVIAHKGEGHVSVLWDNGKKGRYRYGTDQDIQVVEEPRIISPDEPVIVGVEVSRGPDWQWGDQDGGIGAMGSVFRVDPNNVIHVRWPNGKRGNYRYGFADKYDVKAYTRPLVTSPSLEARAASPQVVPPSVDISQQEKEAQRRERIVWEWEREPGFWEPYPQDISNTLETTFQSTPRNTKLIQLKNEMYRVSLAQMKQWPPSNKDDISSIRRTSA